MPDDLARNRTAGSPGAADGRNVLILRRTQIVIFCVVFFFTGLIVGWDLRCGGTTSPRTPVWKDFNLGDTAAADTHAVRSAH